MAVTSEAVSRLVLNFTYDRTVCRVLGLDYSNISARGYALLEIYARQVLTVNEAHENVSLDELRERALDEFRGRFPQ